MKKTISVILFAFACSMCITACTEEEVSPKSEITSSGTAIDPM